MQLHAQGLPHRGQEDALNAGLTKPQRDRQVQLADPININQRCEAVSGAINDGCSACEEDSVVA